MVLISVYIYNLTPLSWCCLLSWNGIEVYQQFSKLAYHFLTWFLENNMDHQHIVPYDQIRFGSIGAERLGFLQVVDVGTCGGQF